MKRSREEGRRSEEKGTRTALSQEVSAGETRELTVDRIWSWIDACRPRLASATRTFRSGSRVEFAMLGPHLDFATPWLDVPRGKGHVHARRWPAESLEEWHERHRLWSP